VSDNNADEGKAMLLKFNHNCVCSIAQVSITGMVLLAVGIAKAADINVNPGE